MDKRGSNSLCNLKLTSSLKLVINVLKKLPPPHSFSLENFSLSIKNLETILAMTDYLNNNIYSEKLLCINRTNCSIQIILLDITESSKYKHLSIFKLHEHK